MPAAGPQAGPRAPQACPHLPVVTAVWKRVEIIFAQQGTTGLKARPEESGWENWGPRMELVPSSPPRTSASPGRPAPLSASLQPRELQVPAADAGERLRRVPLAAAPLPRQPGSGQAGLPAGHQPAPVRAVPVAQERDPAAALRHRAAPAPHAQRARRRGPAERAQAARPRHARARLLLARAAQRRGQRPCGQRPAGGAPRPPAGRARRAGGRRALPALPQLRLGRPNSESQTVWGAGWRWGEPAPLPPLAGGPRGLPLERWRPSPSSSHLDALLWERKGSLTPSPSSSLSSPLHQSNIKNRGLAS